MVIYPGKWIFLATPHTGSTALRFALEHGPMKGTTIPSRVRAPKDTMRGYHHATLADLVGSPHEDKLTGLEVRWSVKRNPYDIAVTWWLRYGKRGVDLATFLREFEDRPWIHQGRIFWHEADKWVEYDNLEAEVNRFLAWFGCPPVQIEAQNVTPDKKPWRSYHTDESLEVMAFLYGKEIEEFGYEILLTTQAIGSD